MLFNLFLFQKLLGVYKHRCGLEDNIEVNLESMLCESVEWFHVTHHMTLLQSAVTQWLSRIAYRRGII